MKKFVLIFLVISLFALSSCSIFPLFPGSDEPKESLAETMLLSSENMFSDFLFDAYSFGTQTSLSDFETLRSSKLQKSSTLISVNALSVLGRELASKESPLSISLTSLNNNENGISHKSTDITYENEKFSSVILSSNDSHLAAFSCLADTYFNFPIKPSVKDIFSDFLSSEILSEDRFSVSRTDCRYEDSVIKDTKKIMLNLENADLSSFVSGIFDYLDPTFRLLDKKEYILNNISTPPGTMIAVYIKDGKTVCSEVTFTISDTEYRARVFFDNSDFYQSAKISFTKSSSPTRNIFSLDFFQTLDNNKKIGTISFSFFPKELFSGEVSLPSIITFDAEYETTISQSRQNCSMTAKLEYTLFGITSSYTFPISIISELLGGNFSTSIAMSAENTEISEFDAKISILMSSVDSLDIPMLSPENVTPIENEEQADDFISSFSLEFGRKYPNLRYLIFKDYRNQGHGSSNIITAKNSKLGETFIFHVNSINSSSISGIGEYVKDFTYTENGNSILITEHSEKSSYLLPSSAEKTILENGSLMFTEDDGTVWHLYPSSMTGYFSKPITISVSVDEGGLSGTLNVYFSDSQALLECVSFNLTETSVFFENNEYKYSVY